MNIYEGVAFLVGIALGAWIGWGASAFDILPSSKYEPQGICNYTSRAYVEYRNLAGLYHGGEFITQAERERLEQHVTALEAC